MKSPLIIAATLIALPFTSAIAQQMTQPPQINVSASAEVKVVPDEIFLSVGVETRDENLTEAQRQNDERVSRALGFLKNSGMKDKDVQTDLVNIEPAYNNEASWTKPAVYIVRKSIEIKVITVTNFEGLLTGLLTNGVNHVYGIDFRTSQLRKYRDEARAMAIQAAREKADAMALGFGVKRGKICNINVNDWGGMFEMTAGNGFHGGYQNSYQNNGMLADVSGEAFSPGQISVSATVNVGYLIE